MLFVDTLIINLLGYRSIPYLKAEKKSQIHLFITDFPKKHVTNHQIKDFGCFCLRLFEKSGICDTRWL